MHHPRASPAASKRYLANPVSDGFIRSGGGQTLVSRGEGSVLRVCVLGASGGIGAALVSCLETDDAVNCVYAGARRPRVRTGSKVEPFACDFSDEGTISRAAWTIERDGPLDLVIVATGLLHRGSEIRPEKSFRQIDAAAMGEVLATNIIGPALVGKYFLPLLAPERRSVLAFLSARVGSIGDNRLGGWHSYRASKAALNALVRCFAIEFGRRNQHGIIASLHPGTVDTHLSMPFRRNVKMGQLLSAQESARHLLHVIDGLTIDDSGGFFAWDGKPIPF